MDPEASPRQVCRVHLHIKAYFFQTSLFTSYVVDHRGEKEEEDCTPNPLHAVGLSILRKDDLLRHVYECPYGAFNRAIKSRGGRLRAC